MALEKQAKDIQAKDWQLTINNPEGHGWSQEKLIEALQLLNPEYFCMARERAETGTEHIHIYLKRKSALRFSTLKNKFPTAHIEKALGSAWQNREYITKTGKWAESDKRETVIEGSFYEWGEIPVKDTKANDRMKEIIHLIKEEKKSPMEIIQKFLEMGLRIKNLEEIQSLCMEEEALKERNIEVIYMFGAEGAPKFESILKKHSPRDLQDFTLSAE